MPCLYSKPAWKTTTPNAKGKHPLHFSGKTTTPDYYIPCGKCIGCHAAKSQEWGIRMFHEAQMHERNSFITLTYENPPEKINREDPQKFIKRLRKQSDRPIRYFLVGEYGELTKRPHYHAIIFGEDWYDGSYDIDGQLRGNPVLRKLWKHGHCSIGQFNIKSAMYTAGYTTKKIGDKDTFSIMSKNPPIGRTWVQANHDNLRRLETCQVSGQTMPIPKQYIKWLEGVEDYAHINENRQQNVQNYTDRQLHAKSLHYKSKYNLRNEKI